MRQETAAALLILAVAVLAAANLLGILGFLNPAINSAIPDIPDASCRTDDDCTLAIPAILSGCLPCDPYACQLYDAERSDVVAVSKDWKPRCAFSTRSIGDACILCAGGVADNWRDGNYTAKCRNSRCAKVRR